MWTVYATEHSDSFPFLVGRIRAMTLIGFYKLVDGFPFLVGRIRAG